MGKKITAFLRRAWEYTCDSLDALWDLVKLVLDRVSKAQDTAQKQADINLARVNADRARQRCAYLEEIEYTVFARAVFECLQDNGHRCGLEQPHHLEQIFAPEGQRVAYSRTLGYCYRFIVRRAYSAGIKDGTFGITYADSYASDMREQLDEVMTTHSLRHGFRAVSVVNVHDDTNNRVIITIATRSKA